MAPDLSAAAPASATTLDPELPTKTVESEMVDEAIARVYVTPKDLAFDAKIGESIMAAAVRNGFRWPSVCQGDAVCGACAVTVESGAENLSPMSRHEERKLESLNRSVPGVRRLACQARVQGAVTVNKRGVR